MKLKDHILECINNDKTICGISHLTTLLNEKYNTSYSIYLVQREVWKLLDSGVLFLNINKTFNYENVYNLESGKTYNIQLFDGQRLKATFSKIEIEAILRYKFILGKTISIRLAPAEFTVVDNTCENE